MKAEALTWVSATPQHGTILACGERNWQKLEGLLSSKKKYAESSKLLPGSLIPFTELPALAKSFCRKGHP